MSKEHENVVFDLKVNIVEATEGGATVQLCYGDASGVQLELYDSGSQMGNIELRVDPRNLRIMYKGRWMIHGQWEEKWFYLPIKGKPGT